MDVLIYIGGSGQGVEMSQENLIGRIDDDGNIYEVDGEDEVCLGWIEFDEGDVFDAEDVLIGWVEDDGTAVAVDEEGDEEIEIGYVNENGQLFAYEGDENEVLVGQLKNMQDYAEGAAALLFFLDIEEE